MVENFTPKSESDLGWFVSQAETLPEDSRGVCLCWGTFSGEYTFGKDLQYRSE
jgi:hypothetical protein